MKKIFLDFIHEKNQFYLFIASLALNIIAWILWSIFTGFEGFSFWEVSPFLGLVFWLTNLVLALFCFEDLRILSWFLTVFTVFIQFLILFQIYKEIITSFLI